jgi:hypothetical protein
MNNTNISYTNSSKNNDIKNDLNDNINDDLNDNISLNDFDDNNYIIKANVCRKLSKILNVDDIKYDQNFLWQPPKEHGLKNCDYIIQPYYKYHEKVQKIFDIDYYEIIKDDIRNFRALNKYQLEYIKQLSNEEKNELFEIFNDCIKSFNDIISN